MSGQDAEAIDDAPDGYILAASEVKVRDLFVNARQQAFKVGLQMRIDAADAAFPAPEHPQTGKNLGNKGRQAYSVGTINGRVSLLRIRWHEEVGSRTPHRRFTSKGESRSAVKSAFTRTIPPVLLADCLDTIQQALAATGRQVSLIPVPTALNAGVGVGVSPPPAG